MRIVFIGCVKSSAILLKELVKNKAEIVGVVTKSNSQVNADFEDLSSICKEYSIDYLYVDNVNDSNAVQFIRKKQPDIIYCFGWSQIIKKEILQIPTKGVVGFHPAKLPHNRGRHPIIWAIALGLEETASTFFMMDEGADTGAIISQKTIEIAYEDDAQKLYDKIMRIASKQVKEFTKALGEGSEKLISQANCETNSWRKRNKKDGEIDWRMPSRGIYNLVRALAKPYVGAHFIYNESEIKVWKVREIIDNTFINIEPGKIIKTNPDGTFLVKCGDNLIHVLECDEIEIKEGEYL